MDAEITYLSLIVGYGKNEKMFTFNNTDGEQKPYAYQYNELRNLVSQFEPAVKNDNVEGYILHKKPKVCLNFISGARGERIELEIEVSRSKIKTLDKVATVHSSDDEDDYEMQLGEFVSECMEHESITFDSFLTVRKIPDDKVLITASVSK